MTSRVMLSFSGLCCGILAGFWLQLSTTVPTGGEVLLVALLIVSVVILVWRLLPNGWITQGWWFFFGILFLSGFYSVRLTLFSPPSDTKEKINMVARIHSTRRVSERMVQLVVSPIESQIDTNRFRSRGKCLILSYPPVDTIPPGSLCEFRQILPSRIRPAKEKHLFQPDRYWRGKGVFYESWIVPGQVRILSLPSGPGIKSLLKRWQEGLSAHYYRMGLSPDSESILAAMVLGERTAMDKSVIQDFSNAGIIHVLSVSGLHVGIIWVLINGLLLRVSILSGAARMLLTLMFVWVYTGLSGFSPSACRAAGMISALNAAPWLSRSPNSLDTLTGVALVHGLLDPYAVFNAGAQLSYLAVAGLFIWMPRIRSFLEKAGKLRYLLNSLAISLAAQSLVIPVLLFWFGWIPLYFIAGNLFILPVILICFYAGIGLLILSLFGMNMSFAAPVIDLPVDISIRLAGWLSDLPGSQIHVESYNGAAVVLYYLTLLFLIRFFRKPSFKLVREWLVLTGILMGIAVLQT